MQFTEIFKDFKQGKWIRREICREDFGIRLCNLPLTNDFPILIETTDGYLWSFGEGFHGDRIKNPTEKDSGPRANEGLQNDLFADDWVLADQKVCNALKRAIEKKNRW
jgi:hypothetical protein